MDSTVGTVFAILLGAIVFGLLLVGAVLVVRDTIRQRGAFGINTSMPECRHCGEPPPVVRVPRSVREAMWGGWTCPQCGLELDKWGEPHAKQSGPAKWSADLDWKRGPGRRSGGRRKGDSDDIRRGDDVTPG